MTNTQDCKDFQDILKLYDDFSRMFTSLEPKQLSDDHCCQLLAWLFSIGGGCEAAVTDKRLNSDIHIAQKRLNLLGGQVPNATLLPTLDGFVKECERFCRKESSKPKWLVDLEKFYGLRPFTN